MRGIQRRGRNAAYWRTVGLLFRMTSLRQYASRVVRLTSSGCDFLGKIVPEKGYSRANSAPRCNEAECGIVSEPSMLTLMGAEQFRAGKKRCGMDHVYRMHRRARDRSRINALEPLEVRYWATSLSCTQPELRVAVSVVGTNVERVRRYLERAWVRIV